MTNARAVTEAVLGRQSPFLRTPKYNGNVSSASDPLLRRRRWVPTGATELVLGTVMLLCFVVTLWHPQTLIGAPFILLFAWGYLGVGLPRFRRMWEGKGA